MSDSFLQSWLLDLVRKEKQLQPDHFIRETIKNRIHQDTELFLSSLNHNMQKLIAHYHHAQHTWSLSDECLESVEHYERSWEPIQHYPLGQGSHEFMLCRRNTKCTFRSTELGVISIHIDSPGSSFDAHKKFQLEVVAIAQPYDEVMWVLRDEKVSADLLTRIIFVHFIHQSAQLLTSKAAPFVVPQRNHMSSPVV